MEREVKQAVAETAEVIHKTHGPYVAFLPPKKIRFLAYIT